MEYGEGSRLLILAPLVMDRKGEHKGIFEDIRKAGFVRMRVDGLTYEVEDQPELDRYKNHTIEAVVDRLIVRPPAPGAEEDERTRLADSVETALNLGGGVMLVSDITSEENPRDRLFSERFACPVCGISMPEIEPRTFSFNSPHGACPTCTGLGSQMEFDAGLIVSDQTKSLADGAIKPWDRETQNYYHSLLESAAAHFHIPFNVPVSELSQNQLNMILNGSRSEDTITITYVNQDGHQRRYQTQYEGVIPNLQRRYRETTSDYVRSDLERYMTNRPCPTCEGRRLRPEALAVTVLDQNIDRASHFSVNEVLWWVEALAGVHGDSRPEGDNGIEPVSDAQIGSPEEVPAGSPLSQREYTIARQILKELHARIRFLRDVGLDYLSLDRAAATLSGGEAQRIRLATQIGSQLMGVLYILDEPSIGLHQRDNARLIQTLLDLRNLGNTVLVIEHDEETMRGVGLDRRPGAGRRRARRVCRLFRSD